MPRVQRSPPSNSSTTNITQTSSDSDIPTLITNSPYEDVNITMRHKRPRTCCSPGSEYQDLKKEIQQMLHNWKTDQEAYFTKFCNDQTSTLNKLVAEMTEVKSQIHCIQKSNDEIEKTVVFINKQYDDIFKQLEILQKEKLSYRESILNLETKIQDIQRLSRPSSVEIRNVPAVENESVSDLADIITKVSSAVDIPLNSANLRDVYRLPGKSGSVRPIVAELTSVQTKNQLLTATRNFNKKHSNDRLSSLSIGLPGERRPIYISEHLPASSRKLFFTTKDFAKLNKFEFCWTINGNIFLRKTTGAKQILVKSEQTLRELERLTEQ
ncbi:uncharacterized protein LOC124537740 [Vanessa cardui]|uniref:uncharacterized protein LOC124537740 n=1 Tax=Vanessa cardui TaxID=171605 RepID=UPI001F140045|nr:uncharacterized protein LOC124537740 [Vanessa cardui]